MHLEADVDAGLVECVQDRQPALRKSSKAVSTRPAGRCGHGYMKGHASAPEKVTLAFKPRFREALAAASTCLTAHPCRALGLPLTCRRREAVEARVEGRMHRDQLALEVRRELGDLDAGLRQTP